MTINLDEHDYESSLLEKDQALADLHRSHLRYLKMYRKAGNSWFDRIMPTYNKFTWIILCWFVASTVLLLFSEGLTWKVLLYLVLIPVYMVWNLRSIRRAETATRDMWSKKDKARLQAIIEGEKARQEGEEWPGQFEYKADVAVMVALFNVFKQVYSEWAEDVPSEDTREKLERDLLQLVDDLSEGMDRMRAKWFGEGNDCCRPDIQ